MGRRSDRDVQAVYVAHNRAESPAEAPAAPWATWEAWLPPDSPRPLLCAPSEITPGPDGNLWFTESANKIGRITPAGAITEFPVPTANGDPWGIAAGPDGNLWFTEYSGNKMGRIVISPTSP